MPLLSEKRFELATQELHNWCWASVSAGIHGYLTKGEALKQCEIAGLILGDPSCCAKPADFDQPHSLTQALNATLPEIGWQAELLDGPYPFEKVKAEIDDGRPVCARILWPDNLGAHLNVIYGYRIADDGSEQVYVSDPFFVDSVIDYDYFSQSYEDEGKWDKTILIRRKQ